MTQKALIFGITGQDGTYLSELLLSKGYEVYGAVRKSSLSSTARIAHLVNNPALAGKINLLQADLTDGISITQALYDTSPDEIYNLAAQSETGFSLPELTSNTNALGALRILEAMRVLNMAKKARYYQASSSELFGNSTQSPQNETTEFRPCNPYAISKLHAYWTAISYRNAYNIHASNGILFSHESPLRAEHFVSRKISQAVAAIHLGLQEKLSVGNLNAKRDWGHARDFVEGIWQIVQQEKPDDYVLATGKSYSVRQCIETAFAVVGRTLRWSGDGVDEKGFDAATSAVLVEVNPVYFRPCDVESLLGDSSKARKQLGWSPRTSFQELIAEMVNADLKRRQKSG